MHSMTKRLMFWDKMIKTPIMTLRIKGLHLLLSHQGITMLSKMNKCLPLAWTIPSCDKYYGDSQYNSLHKDTL